MPSAEHQQSSCEKLELKADERILKRIIKLRDDYAKKHEEIANKRSARILSLVSEYKTEEEVQEAYGWDLITETEKDEICAIFRGAAAESQMETEYSIMISWLNSWIRTVKSAIEELRYQQMTPKQKAEHERAVEDWNNKIDMLRRKTTMSNEQLNEISDCLVKFVKRVSDGQTTCETEVEVLPQVVSVLIALSHIL